jgi:hypothetical protein
MRISITVTAVLVLLSGAVGYSIGARQRHVEPDVWAFASAKMAFQYLYDCETGVNVSKGDAGCEPLTFTQAHARDFELIPLDRARTPPPAAWKATLVTRCATSVM